MKRYLESLPDGARSYPQCEVKASVLRNFFKGVNTSVLRDALPPVLAAFLEHPSPPNTWISETQTSAIYMASADTVFSSTTFLEHAYQTNYSLLDSNMYRVLFRLGGVRRILAKFGDNWAMFHRGTSATLLRLDESGKGGRLRLQTPPNLIPLLLASAYGTGFRAALEIAGERDVSCAVTSYESDQVIYTLKWK